VSNSKHYEFQLDELKQSCPLSSPCCSARGNTYVALQRTGLGN